MDANLLWRHGDTLATSPCVWKLLYAAWMRWRTRWHDITLLSEGNKQTKYVRCDSRVVTHKLGYTAVIISFNLIVQSSDGAGETVFFINLNYQLNSLGKNGTSLTKTYEVKDKNSPQIHLTAKWGSDDASQRTYSCVVTKQEGNVQSRVKIIIRNKCLEKPSPLNNSCLFSHNPIKWFQVGVTAAREDLCVIMAVKVALCAVLLRCAVRRFLSPLPERCSEEPPSRRREVGVDWCVCVGGGCCLRWAGR